MDFQTEITLIPRLLVALVLGVLIGLDREIDGHAAGIRTYAAVCLGATLVSTPTLKWRIRPALLPILFRALAFWVPVSFSKMDPKILFQV